MEIREFIPYFIILLLLMACYDSRILQRLLTSRNQHHDPVSTDPSDRQPHDPLTTDLPVRLARASPSGDKMSDFADHILLVSRIANGIVLRSGLIESSIPVNDVLAELLRTGPMTPDELLALNKELVDDLMKMMKKASAQLEKNAEAVEMDNHYNNMNSVIKSEFDMKAFEKLAGKQEYETVLAELKKVVVNENLITQAVGNSSALLLHLRTVTGKWTKLVGVSPLIKDEVKPVLERYNQDILPIVTTKLKELKEKSSFVNLLIEEEKLRKRHENIEVNGTADAQAADNYKLLDELGSHLAKNPEIIRKFVGFASALQSNRHPDLKYTAGLPNGVVDLNKILQDVADKWFLKSASIDQDTTRLLREVFMPLDSLSTDLKKVVDAWEPAKAKVAEAVLSLQLRLGSNSANAATRKTTMNAMKVCHTKYPTVPIHLKGEIDEVIKPIIDLNDEVEKLGGTSTTVLFKNFDLLMNTLTFKNNTIPAMNEEAPEMFKKLKAMPEFEATIEQLESFENNARSMQTLFANLSTTVTNIESNLVLIDQHQKAVIGVKFGEWYDCMKAVKDNAAPVAEMIGDIQKLREVGVQGISDTETFLTTIQTSASPLRSAKDKAESMVEVKEFASKILKLPEDSNKGVTALGSAARRLIQIVEVMRNRPKLKPLMDDLAFMTKAADGVKSSLTAKDQTSLKELASLPKSLTEMFAGVDALSITIESFTGKELNDCKDVMEAAQKVKGVKTEAGKWKVAVEALAQNVPSIQKQLADISATLDVVQKLELDFASFKTDEAMAMLDRLAEFFHELQKTTGSRPGGGHSLLESSTGALSPIAIIIIVTVVSIIVMVICAILFIIWYRKCHQKLSKEEIDARNERDIRSVRLAMSRMLEVAEAFTTYACNRMRDNGECLLYILERINNVAVGQDFVVDFPEDELRYSNYRVNIEGVVSVVMRNGRRKYLNANMIMMNDPPYRGRVYIMGQTPLSGKEPGKRNTFEAAYTMFEQNDVRLCVLLKSPHDTQLECPNFFPKRYGQRMRIGPYEVKLRKKIAVRFAHDNASYTMYRVRYRRGLFINFLVCRKMDFDRNHPTPPAAAELVEFMRLYPEGRSIAVLCPSGVERAATLIGVRTFMNNAEHGSVVDFAAWVQQLRSIRHNALTRPITLWFAYTAMVKGLLERFSAEKFFPTYPAMLFMYNKFVRGEFTRAGVNFDGWQALMNLRAVFVAETKARWRAAHPDWAQHQDEDDERREEEDAQSRMDRDEARERQRRNAPRIDPLIPLAEQQNRNRPLRPLVVPGRARPRSPARDVRYEAARR